MGINFLFEPDFEVRSPGNYPKHQTEPNSDPFAYLELIVGSLIWFIILGLPRRQAHASDKILPIPATSAAAALQKQQLINNRIHFIYRTNANRLTSKKKKKLKKKEETKDENCISMHL